MIDLLKKWLNGKATWSEEKKLRQVTEQDHFLAEAMEGYDAFPIIDHATKIEQLKGRLRKPQKEKKSIVLSYFKVAAAAAVVIGVVSTFFWVQLEIEQSPIISQAIEEIEPAFSQHNEKNNAIAAESIVPKQSETELDKANKKFSPKPIIQQTPNPNKPTKQISTTNPSNPSNHPTPLTETTNSSSIVKAIKEISEVDLPAAVNLTEPPIIAATQENEPVVAKTVEPEIAADISYNTTAPISAEKRSYSKQRNSKYKEATVIDTINYYAGQVQNEEGQPMSNVKIVGLNTSFNTRSSPNGAFILKTDVPLTKIVVSKEGFHTRKIAINQYSDFLNVSLVKQSAKTPSNSENTEMVTLAPKPEIGFVNFFNYIKENQKYPQGAKAKSIEREVEIRFYIDKNGTPTKFKISNSDLYGFDEEAIRLLKNGPKWMPIHSHARCYIPFEME